MTEAVMGGTPQGASTPARTLDGRVALVTGAGSGIGRAAALADGAGLTLIQMAVAFVVRHPAVTAAIVGPRTMEQLESYLAADGVDLSGELLDRIDQVVPPGVTLHPEDNMSFSPALHAATRRR